MIPGKPARIQSIDALRGFCVTLMCVHHLLYDLCAFLGAPWWLFTNPVLDVAHEIVAGIFILLSGISSRFSRSNLRRGGKLFGIALVMTGVTLLIDRFALVWFGEDMGTRILFGVLHLLGFCMLFYGLTGKLWDRLPGKIAVPLYIVLTALTARAAKGHWVISAKWLFPLGFVFPGFYSGDYFPILPWLFVFLLGTWVGGKIREGKLPDRFYTAQFPFFPKVGRHALLIYLAHQPVLAGLVWLIGAVCGIL